MSRTPPVQGKLPSLTSARAFAAGAIFLVHCLYFIPAYPFLNSDIAKKLIEFLPMQFGSFCVAFFFVLSGFVIYWSSGQRENLNVPGYLKRRIVKLWPTHLIFFGLFAAATVIPWSRLITWLPNALLIHTWIPSWTKLGGMNVPSWSLCAELLFYLSFPLFLPLLRRIPKAKLWQAVTVVIVVLFLIDLSITLFAPGAVGTENVPGITPWAAGTETLTYEIHADPRVFHLASWNPDIAFWLAYDFPPTRLLEFWLGAIAARLVISGQWKLSSSTWPMVSLVLAYAVSWIIPVPFKMSFIALIPMTALVASMAVRDLKGDTRVMATKPMVWAGNISFAFYLAQFPVMVWVTRFLLAGHKLDVYGWIAASILVALIAGLLSHIVYTYIDDPLMRGFARRPWIPKRQRRET